MESSPIAYDFDPGLQLPQKLKRHIGQSALAWFRNAAERTWYLCGAGAAGEPLTAELRHDAEGRCYVHVRAASSAELLGDRSDA
jgi:hypothetical protein